MGQAKHTILDGEALEKALAEGRFNQAAAELIGMVKASEKGAHVSFARAGCESWLDIPNDMIDEAEHIGQQFCKGHLHPVFRLSLKEPMDPQAKVLMQLLAGREPMMAFAKSSDFPSASPGAASLRRNQQCDTWCAGSTLMCACPVYVPDFGYGIIVYACGTCIDDPVFTGLA